MKISKKAWHYRYMCGFLHADEPKSLCTYFWTLMFVLVGSPFIFAAMGLSALIDKTIDKFTNRKVPQEVGLLRSYYRAVKNKACPIIEYE